MFTYIALHICVLSSPNQIYIFLVYLSATLEEWIGLHSSQGSGLSELVPPWADFDCIGVTCWADCNGSTCNYMVFLHLQNKPYKRMLAFNHNLNSVFRKNSWPIYFVCSENVALTLPQFEAVWKSGYNYQFTNKWSKTLIRIFKFQECIFCIKTLKFHCYGG